MIKALLLFILRGLLQQLPTKNFTATVNNINVCLFTALRFKHLPWKSSAPLRKIIAQRRRKTVRQYIAEALSKQGTDGEVQSLRDDLKTSMAMLLKPLCGAQREKNLTVLLFSPTTREQKMEG